MKLHPGITNPRSIQAYKNFKKKLIGLYDDKCDYSEAVYTGAKNPITITCKIHNFTYKQRAEGHLKSSGCSRCKNEAVGNRLRKSVFSFIAEAVEVHNDFYTYSNISYHSAHEPVIITCPIHGDFKQVPTNHLKGVGCRKCGIAKSSQAKKSSTQEFILQAKAVHNNTYTYTNVEYTTARDNVKITCPIHGDFEQTPSSHLVGSGCPRCLGRNKTTKDFIKESQKVHNNKYYYSNTIYTNAKSKVIITCSTHGDFEQIASDHLSGRGCSSCTKTGFDGAKSAVLYYLSINNGEAYKIGITNRTIKERFGLDMSNIRVLHQIHYKSGKDAYNEEQRILREFIDHKYTGPDLLKSGNTELFKTNILNLAYEKFKDMELFSREGD